MLKKEASAWIGACGRAGWSPARGWWGLVFWVAAGSLALWALVLPDAASAAGTMVAFTTQGCTTWTVPTRVSSVQIQATGAAGGGAGGLGDGVSGTLSGLAGGTQVLDVCVDQGGGPGGPGQFGGSPGGNGGGASGVSLGADFSSPMLVAGGGGGQGGGGGGAGGRAGMPVAGSGGNSVVNGGGGGDNTTAMGGGAGTSAQPLCDAGAGGQFGPAGPGSGGPGGAGVCGNGGGGGGGGYFGGGGGASAGAPGAGGGGGTDFCATPITGCTVSSGVGTQTTAGSATGDAQVTITYTVVTAPSVSITMPASGAIYAQGQFVSSSFGCTEGAGGSGIGSCLDENGHPSGTATDTSTPGQHTFTVTATSTDGLTADSSVTYTVAAAPSVQISSPQNGATYVLGQVVDSGFGCLEGASGPGLASCTGTTPAGAPIDTSSAGAHTFTATAVSGDGQRISQTVTYTVAPPDNYFRISKVRARPNGSVTFTVTFPGAGIADVLETAWRDNFAHVASVLEPAPARFVFARHHLVVSRAGAIRVIVRPNRRGKKLVAHHSYQVVLRLWVSFTPTGGKQRNVGLYGLHVTHPKP
jgi:hypothetical protein